MKQDKRFYTAALLAYIVYMAIAIYYAWDSKIGDILITAQDEMSYIYRTDALIRAIQTDGLWGSLVSYYTYTNSVHFGYYYVLSFFRILFDDSFLGWIIVQVTVLFFGAFFFARFASQRLTNPKWFSFIFFGVLMYVPLALHAFTMMRDIFIFSLLSLSLYLYAGRRYYLLMISVLVLFTFRLNAALCALVFIGLAEFQRAGDVWFKARLAALFLVLVLVVNTITYGYLFHQISDRVQGVAIVEIFIQYFRFFISPLPWAVTEELPEILKFWFWISFPFSVMALAYLFMMTMSRRLFSVLPFPLLGMYLVYVFIYSTEGTLGFRQSAGIAPYVFAPLLVGMVTSFKGRRLRMPAEQL